MRNPLNGRTPVVAAAGSIATAAGVILAAGADRAPVGVLAAAIGIVVTGLGGLANHMLQRRRMAMDERQYADRLATEREERVRTEERGLVAWQAGEIERLRAKLRETESEKDDAERRFDDLYTQCREFLPPRPPRPPPERPP